MALDGPVLDDGGEVVMSKWYPSQPKSAEATAMGAVGGGALGTRARHAHTTLPLFVGQCTLCLPEPSHSTHLGHPAPTHPHHLGPHAHAPMCRS